MFANEDPRLLLELQKLSLHFSAEALSIDELQEAMQPWVPERRKARIEEVLADRWKSIIPVLEGIYDQGNVNAILRSSEGLGLQEVHIIESTQSFRQANRVSLGSEKWIEKQIWKNPIRCLQTLREKGIQVVATRLEDSVPLENISLKQTTAFIFGNEKEGVSPELLPYTDAAICLPMRGFTQSFNVSVAAALCLSQAIELQRKEHGLERGNLTDVEKKSLRVSYYLRSLPYPDRILNDYFIRKTQKRKLNPAETARVSG